MARPEADASPADCCRTASARSCSPRQIGLHPYHGRGACCVKAPASALTGARAAPALSLYCGAVATAREQLYRTACWGDGAWGRRGQREHELQGATRTMANEIIRPTTVHSTTGYSHAVRAGN